MGEPVALVESPAQLLSTIEWVASTESVGATAVVVAPTTLPARLQLHRVGDWGRGLGVGVDWVDVRPGPGGPLRRLLAAARGVRGLTRTWRRLRRASTWVIGDPYAGIVQLLLLAAGGGAPRIVVVDDGSATRRLVADLAAGRPLVRWHRVDAEGGAGPAARLLRALRASATRHLRRAAAEGRLELFTFMVAPGETDLPVRVNDLAAVRSTLGPPEVVEGVDLLGTSLVETGVLTESAYLGALERLVAEHGLRRYLPHRRESPEKLARVAALGVEVTTPVEPLEMAARRGPVSRELWSFPSTVLTTLPLVVGEAVTVRALSIDDDWWSAGLSTSAKDFVRSEAGGRPTS